MDDLDRRLTAAEAHEWGVVSRWWRRPISGAAAERAAALAAGPTYAIAATKKLYDQAATATLEEQLEREAEAQAKAAQTADFREGVAAFGEKRPPSFSGRCRSPAISPSAGKRPLREDRLAVGDDVVLALLSLAGGRVT